MGNILNQPITDKHVESFMFMGNKGTIVSMQGWRTSMEDTHIVEPDLSWFSGCGFFGVFDGHGGSYTSDYCKNNLTRVLQTEFKGEINKNLSADEIAVRIRDIFISFDSEIRKSQQTRGGSTAICSLITPTHFIVSNLGDSRCVLSRDGEANPLSVDHKPALEQEKRRIYNAGGIVMNNRVNGDLGVSRAFGDFSYKQNVGLAAPAQQVSCEPDVRVISRVETDNYLVMACDGLWDVYPNPKDLVNDLNGLIEMYATIEEAVCRLIDMCLERGSKDNISCMVLLFSSAPKPIEEKVKQRIEMEEEAKKRKECEVSE